MIITDRNKTFIINMQEVYHVNRQGAEIIVLYKNGRCFSFSKPTVELAIDTMAILSDNDWKSSKKVTV